MATKASLSFSTHKNDTVPTNAVPIVLRNHNLPPICYYKSHYFYEGSSISLYPNYEGLVIEQ